MCILVAAAMLATQLNHMVTSNAIQRNGIIKLTKYLCNIVSGRRIVIILGIDVLSGDVGEVIESCLACADITFFCNWMHVDGSCPVFTLKVVGDTIIVQHKVIAANVEMLCHHFVKVAYLDSFH